MTHWLSLAIWIPIGFGVAILAAGRDRNLDVIRAVALIGSVLGLLVTIPLYTGFDPSLASLQFVENVVWIERLNANYHLGVDGISVWFVLLTAFMTVIVVLAGWQVIETRVSQYYAAFLILSGLMVGVFAAADGLLFFVFFEATLVPMYVIIGVWGGANRLYAAIKFFLYTFAGSLLMLVALVYLYYASDGSFGIFDWHQLRIGHNGADAALYRVPCGVRRQGTDVAGAHVAARCARRSTYRRIDHPGCDHVEARRVRFPALLAADCSRCVASVGWLHHRAVVDRRRLHRPGRPGAVGHEEARRVFVDRAYGLRDARLLHLQPAGHGGRHRADDLARLRIRRDVLLHRRDVRPHALAEHRRLRRCREYDAEISRHFSCCS